MNIRIVKIIWAILLLICLFQMPYGYYQFVRFISTAGFGYLSYNANRKKDETMFFVFLGLALLFQPFLKVALGRQVWNIVDLFVAFGLIISSKKNND